MKHTTADTMKAIALAFAASLSLSGAHEGVERGPNGGRILEFSKDETMHGEVTVKDGRFQVALLDKDMKPVAVTAQALTATSGDRTKPVKLTVKTEPRGFSLPVVPEGDWLILQFRSSSDARPITARMEYNTKTCDGCSAPEWLCQCESGKGQKK
jgi:hypothetical protein